MGSVSPWAMFPRLNPLFDKTKTSNIASFLSHIYRLFISIVADILIIIIIISYTIKRMPVKGLNYHHIFKETESMRITDPSVFMPIRLPCYQVRNIQVGALIFLKYCRLHLTNKKIEHICKEVCLALYQRCEKLVQVLSGL